MDHDSPSRFIPRAYRRGTLLVSGGAAIASARWSCPSTAGAVVYRALRSRGCRSHHLRVHRLTASRCPRSIPSTSPSRLRRSTTNRPSVRRGTRYDCRAGRMLTSAAPSPRSASTAPVSRWRVVSNSDPADSGAVLLGTGPYVIKWGQCAVCISPRRRSKAVASTRKTTARGIASPSPRWTRDISVDGSNASKAVIPQILGRQKQPLPVTAPVLLRGEQLREG